MSKSFKDLLVYQKAFKLAMEIYHVSKSFPVEEKYFYPVKYMVLTFLFLTIRFQLKDKIKQISYYLTGHADQIRRASRSVCSNLAESYRKRQYEAHFVSKVSDADMENSETQVWLDFSHECKYISKETHDNLIARSEEVGRLLNHMIANPEKYRSKS